MKRLEEILTYATYLGQLAGCPAPEEMFERAKDRAKAVFGEDRPIYLIPATATENKRGDRTFMVLPRWTHIAVLAGASSDPTSDGTDLTVIWFSSNPKFERPSIDEQTWQAHARNFSF